MIEEPVGHIVDATTALIVVGVFAKVLPIIATMLTIVWYTIRLIDYFKSRKNNKQ